MSKFYMISDTDYDAVWGWDKVIELERRGFVRVPYTVYLAHMRKVSQTPRKSRQVNHEVRS